MEDSPGTLSTPKAFTVTIEGGAVSLAGQGFTLPLPIQGSGKFEVVYNDDKLRVFRSAGGSLTVQVREDVLDALL